MPFKDMTIVLKKKKDWERFLVSSPRQRQKEGENFLSDYPKWRHPESESSEKQEQRIGTESFG